MVSLAGIELKDEMVRFAFKAAVMVYFIISVFSLMASYSLGVLYSSVVILLNILGFFCYTHMENKDAMEVHLITMAWSILFDVVILAVYGENLFSGWSSDSKTKFSGAMAIINLIFKIPYVMVFAFEYMRRGGAMPDVSFMSAQSNSSSEAYPAKSEMHQEPEMKSAPVEAPVEAPAYDEPASAVPEKQATSAENMA
eukprot:Nk52_evm9s311 gene=Nk52_evmTU9s311